VKAMKDPRNQPKPRARTNMSKALSDILEKYQPTLVNGNWGKKRVLKNLTIIVLTDGLWDDLSYEDDADKTIVNFVRKLENTIGDLIKDRPVSIEFVQFGKDKKATKRLHRLDNDLVKQGVP